MLSARRPNGCGLAYCAPERGGPRGRFVDGAPGDAGATSGLFPGKYADERSSVWEKSATADPGENGLTDG